MNQKILISILALGLLSAAGPALAWHPANDPSVGYNVEALDQAHAAYLAAHPQEYAFAPRAALPTREDFETIIIGDHYPGCGVACGDRPWIQYSLKEPGRFRFELQQMHGEWRGPGIGN